VATTWKGGRARDGRGRAGCGLGEGKKGGSQARSRLFGIHRQEQESMYLKTIEVQLERETRRKSAEQMVVEGSLDSSVGTAVEERFLLVQKGESA
jgi:hypothetical protein